VFFMHRLAEGDWLHVIYLRQSLTTAMVSRTPGQDSAGLGEKGWRASGGAQHQCTTCTTKAAAYLIEWVNRLARDMLRQGNQGS
jgi:hypothetical protein